MLYGQASPRQASILNNTKTHRCVFSGSGALLECCLRRCFIGIKSGTPGTFLTRVNVFAVRADDTAGHGRHFHAVIALSALFAGTDFALLLFFSPLVAPQMLRPRDCYLFQNISLIPSSPRDSVCLDCIYINLRITG